MFTGGHYLGLSENSKPHVKVENESGKSSQLLSLICPILAYLGYNESAKSDSVEFSDTPYLLCYSSRRATAFSMRQGY